MNAIHPPHIVELNDDLNPIEITKSELVSLQSSLKQLIEELQIADDEHSKALLDFLTEKSWLETIESNLAALGRIQDRSLTPVTYGIMGRQSVGKTTIFKEVLGSREDSLVHDMPTRDSETTACAVRWTDQERFDLRYDVERQHMLLKTFSVDGETRALHISLARDENEYEQRVLGLEATAHPAPHESLKLIRTSEGPNTYKVIQDHHSSPAGESLVDVATYTRIATIGTDSALVNTERGLEPLLKVADVMDFPGADATNGRAEIFDKASRVFDHNTHECDVLYIVIKPEGDALNLGKQIQEGVSVRWLLRCILSADKTLKLACAQSIVEEYCDQASMSALMDFLQLDGEPQPSANIQALSEYIAHTMLDAEMFWAWLEKRRAHKTAAQYDEFKSCVLFALQRDPRFTQAMLKDGRLAFIVNRAHQLLDGDKGFSAGIDKSFWSSFISTTLHGVPGALAAFNRGDWPHFFLVDLAGEVEKLGLCFEMSRKELKHKLDALKSLFCDRNPIILRDHEELLRQWHYKIGDHHNLDITRSKDEQKKKQRRKSYELVQGDKLLSRIHDLAQSWWWCGDFVGLPRETRSAIYEWTIDACGHLMHRDETHDLGGVHFIREQMVQGAQGVVLDVKERESEVKLAQVQLKLRELKSEIMPRGEGDQALDQLRTWSQEVQDWPYWEHGHGMIIDRELKKFIEREIIFKEDVDLNEAGQRMIEMACSVGVRQMAHASKMSEHTIESLTRWVIRAMSEDAPLRLFRLVHLDEFKIRNERCDKEFMRAVFTRMGVLLNRFRRLANAPDEPFLSACARLMSEDPILSEIQQRLSLTEGA